MLRLFLFRGLAGLDNLAQRAGMFAIESLDKRLLKRAILRIGDEHASPGDALKKDPMQAQPKDQSQNTNKPYSPNHDA